MDINLRLVSTHSLLPNITCSACRNQNKFRDNRVMRNLKTVRRSLLCFSGHNQLPLAATVWDAAADALICAFGPSKSRAQIELKRLYYNRSGTEERLDSIAAWDAPCPLPSLEHDAILNLHHFSDTSTSCLILAGGDIVLVRENPQSAEELVEIVGSVDAGITAAAWSPDEELLTVTTQADTLLLMSRDIQNIGNITLTTEDINVSKHVSVGWGKKETQFKGKRARALQDPTVPETIDAGVLSPYDDGSVTISWRGDAAYFAINKIEEQRRRLIRVFTREGQLDSVSEPVDGLEGALSWRPSGNLIAGIRRSSEKIEVIFFERNGLRHGQFDLPTSGEELHALTTPLALQWNSDSTVLAVLYPSKTQMWTMSNYHYYLKTELTFPGSNNRKVVCIWNSERSLTVALSTLDALQLLEYVSTTSRGSTAAPNDFGMVASIDGLNLKLTPLRIANIPPPMSLHNHALKSKPVDIAFSISGTQMAVLSDEDISIYSLDMIYRPNPKPIMLWRSDVVKGHSPRHVTFAGDGHVYVLTDAWDKNESYLWQYTKEAVLSLGSMAEAQGVMLLTSSNDNGKLFAQFQDGTLHQISIDKPEEKLPLQTTFIHRFPSPSSEVQLLQHEGETLAFGLTKTGHLHVNERLLARNCTSFAVTPAHLIFTTSQHLLKFVHITHGNELEIPGDEPQRDERCRSVERGARIVTVMPTAYSVVLQMPRGNLETIYPRALVLAAIRRSIEAGRYDEAFFACRNQRVDMNFLHDHDPIRFESNIEDLITQIKRVEHLDLLLSQLRNEDVSKTMYKETIKSKSSASKFNLSQDQVKNKVNRICDGFLSILMKPRFRNDYLQSIITSHVSKTPPDLDAALELIAGLQESSDESVDKAAEHICFLADINQLYDASLGLYNLELALLIAQQSQKDPREYLPQLQTLENLPLLRRKFNIDNLLGRREKALVNLQDLGAFDEVKDYTQNHGLYAEALRLYQYDKLRLKEIMRLHAKFLETNNKHKEAGLAYEYLGDHGSAWPCYRSANLWRETLSSAILAKVSPEQLHSIASSLVDGLVESKDYLSASTIALDYLCDLSSAARFLCKGCYFAEAMRIATLRGQIEVIVEVVDVGLVERSADMTEFLADMKGQLLAQVPRLRELRAKKAQDPLTFYEGLGDGEADIPDNVSLAPTDTTSGGTFMTRYTNQTGTINTQTTRKTSKNKRREERKRARGKKGTVYEEEYLVNSIERLIERINSIQDEIQRLIEGLVRRDMRERAAAVSNAVTEVIESCHRAVEEIYPASRATPGDSTYIEGSNGFDGGSSAGKQDTVKPTGADSTLWDSLQEVSREKKAPVVSSLAKLCILD